MTPTDALFKSVSKRPPNVEADSAEYLAKNEPQFARWVIYQDTQCDRHGCLP